MAPVAPNFLLEVKRPSGDANLVKRQGCYNGALGARGMYQLQSYKHQKPVYDCNAYTITTSYHAGTLNMYTTHPTQADGTTEYHMSRVDGWNTLGNPGTCRRAFTALRNSRDLAQEQRDAFVFAANERAKATTYDESQLSTLESSNYNSYSDKYPIQESETSVAELAYVKPKASNKRRNKASETVFKVPRRSDGRPGRSGSKR